MNNWLRCNNCYARASIAKEPFTLTQCRHIYCSRCIGSAGRQCPVCNTVNVPTLYLQEPLDASIAPYFLSLTDQLQHIITISKFQEEQIQISLKRFNDLDARYRYCKEVCRKLEIGAAKLHQKYRQDKEEYAKRLSSLENENMQLKIALDSVQGNAFGKFQSTQNRASSSSNLQHTCNKRFQQNVSKVSFSTPLSTTSNAVSNASSSLDRTYLSSLPGSNGIFQIPNIRKVPKSGGNKSSASTSSTLPNMFPRHLRIDS